MYAVAIWFSLNMYECPVCCCEIVGKVPQQTSSHESHWCLQLSMSLPKGQRLCPRSPARPPCWRGRLALDPGVFAVVLDTVIWSSRFNVSMMESGPPPDPSSRLTSAIAIRYLFFPSPSPKCRKHPSSTAFPRPHQPLVQVEQLHQNTLHSTLGCNNTTHLNLDLSPLAGDLPFHLHIHPVPRLNQFICVRLWFSSPYLYINSLID